MSNSPSFPAPPPGATVVVPTLNREDYLGDCLRDLLAQTYRPLEILVVDQSLEAPPHVRRLVEASGELINYYRVTFRGLPSARNFGWHHARYPAIVFVDDDIRCGPNFVAEHVASLREPRVGVVAGGIDEKSKFHPGGLRRSRGFRRWTASPAGPYSDATAYDVDAAKGCNFSVWKSVLEELGGFDQALNLGAALYEDLEFCLRVRGAGYRIRFNGQARLQHLAAPAGGCRVKDPRKYVQSLAHNRSLVIARHLRWLERPTALARLAGLVLSYTRANRDAGVLLAGIRGAMAGLPQGFGPPLPMSEEQLTSHEQ
jgi:GT2 family glycosyltransferase